MTVTKRKRRKSPLTRERVLHQLALGPKTAAQIVVAVCEGQVAREQDQISCRKVLRALKALGLIESCGVRPSTGGRRPMAWRVNGPLQLSGDEP